MVTMHPPRIRLDLLKRYGIAVAAAMVALLIRYALPVPEGTTIYQLPLAAVVFSAWLGGRGPGLVALLICTTGILYWMIPPSDAFELPRDYALGFVLFIALGVLLTTFSAARWRTQRALEETERRFRAMAEAVPEMLWFESIEPRRMLYVSPKFEEIWGRPVRDLQRAPEMWLEAIHPEQRGQVRSAYSRWLAGDASDRFDMRFSIVRPDGKTRVIHSRATLIRDEQGKPYRASGIAADITDEIRAVEALARAKMDLAHVTRMTTVGQLTASIAHEVNQPLGAMVANAAACEHWLAATPPQTEKARKALKSIIADGQRSSAVIGRVRALMKRQPARTELVDINEAIREVVALAQAEVDRHDVALEMLLAGDLPRVPADRIQLEQVLLNLIVNGMEAMSAPGPIPRRLVLSSAKEGTSGVRVSVADNGVGLAPEAMDHLFDPFYTTKAEGIGMGLAISRAIVESHGGHIWATANTPQGTVFQFTVPGEAAS